MRDIKFRAWDKRYGGRMVSWQEIYDGMNFGLFTDEGFDVEQFTGLRDKNGRDIYEGDIVRFPAIDIGLKGKWATGYIDHDGGCAYSIMGISPLDFEGSEESLSDISVSCDFVVVGNVHENL